MALLVGMSFLLGALLGIKFRVLILIPALGAILLTVVAIGIAHAHAVWAILVTLAAAVSSLQIGYLGGAIMQYALALPTTDRRRTQPLSTEPAIR
jgi:membrane protein DedA with SNARE-associated domain